MKSLVNFRGLEGLKSQDGRKVRKGIYRTACLSKITEPDAHYLVQDLKIRRYIDFRSDLELQRFGRPDPLFKKGVEHFHVPIVGRHLKISDEGKISREDWVDCYWDIIGKAGAAVRKIMFELARPTPSPFVIGCLAGKDRTGVSAALILSVLKVSETDIIKNYAETTTHLLERIDFFSDIWKNDPKGETHYRCIFEAEAEIMHEFLRQMNDREGGITEFLIKNGVTEESMESARETWLE